jgi:steroid delta-isomerase-like uncharacterized protein
MSADQNRKTMLRFYEAINRHDVETIGDCLAEDNVAHCIPEEFGQTREAYLQFMQLAFEAFPAFRMDALDVVAEGDRVAVRYRNTGTHEGEFMGIPASGRAFKIEGSDFCRFDEEGKIVAHWAYADQLEFMQQLGAIPEDIAG